MNKVIIFAFLFQATVCYAQNVKIAEPEFSGTIVHVNSTGGIPLETTKLALKKKPVRLCILPALERPQQAQL